MADGTTCSEEQCKNTYGVWVQVGEQESGAERGGGRDSVRRSGVPVSRDHSGGIRPNKGPCHLVIETDISQGVLPKSLGTWC